MGKGIGMIKTVYVAAALVLLLVSFRMFVWERVLVLRSLTEELEIQRRIMQIKEINYSNLDENRVIANEDTRASAILTDIGEVALASLNVGELMKRYGLTETGISYDSYTEQTDIPGTSLVKTGIVCGFMGDYKAAMDFLQALGTERYAYKLSKLRLSSAGMPVNQISAGIELLLFSTVPVADDEPDKGIEKVKNSFEDYGYENPFYYTPEKN